MSSSPSNSTSSHSSAGAASETPRERRLCSVLVAAASLAGSLRQIGHLQRQGAPKLSIRLRLQLYTFLGLAFDIDISVWDLFLLLLLCLHGPDTATEECPWGSDLRRIGDRDSLVRQVDVTRAKCEPDVCPNFACTLRDPRTIMEGYR